MNGVGPDTWSGAHFFRAKNATAGHYFKITIFFRSLRPSTWSL